MRANLPDEIVQCANTDKRFSFSFSDSLVTFARVIN